MNPETINAIKDALDPLLSKAGQSIDTLYQLCAIQNQVEIINCWIPDRYYNIAIGNNCSL